MIEEENQSEEVEARDLRREPEDYCNNPEQDNPEPLDSKASELVCLEHAFFKIHLQSSQLGVVRLLELALITRDGIMKEDEEAKKKLKDYFG
ncbi:hypothetical protein J4462_04010 [Candidatus Pacearchaeota archaeon]|nr:hypothetical protein [Candidatus Pacearchaeota archaeon]